MSSFDPRPPYLPPPEPPGYRTWGPYGPPPPRRVRARRGGLWGALLAALGVVVAYAKYALLFIGKFGVLKTLITLVISFAIYAQFFGGWFALGLVLMILVHEMGHVVEIRRQGMRATAPLFIPFFGAAIFQRSHPTDALKQAQIGIAGPIAGTLGATAALLLYNTSHWEPLLVWAWLGFYINLFNLIPVGMLDGGWILGAVSKWFQLLGLAALGAAIVLLHVNPIILIIVLISIPAIIDRFRNDHLPYYRSVPAGGRLAMGAAWLLLVGYLAFSIFQASQLLPGGVG